MAKLNLEGIQIPQKSQDILDHTQKQMGFIPNMYQSMAGNEALLDGYTAAYNSFRANSGFSAIEQEVIFISVAYANQCEYCVSVHSFVADNWSKVPIEITDAIRAGKTLPDDKLDILSKTAIAMTNSRGNLTQEEVDRFLAAGYTPSHLLGIIAAIGVKIMSNYSNHITHPDLDEAFLGRKWTAPAS